MLLGQSLSATNCELETLKSRLSACNTKKSYLETELRSLQKENVAIKDFKSDLSSVNVELLKECRQENQQFSAKLSETQEEVSDLHGKLSEEKERCNALERSEKEFKTKVTSNQRKCQLLEKKIIKLECKLQTKEEEIRDITKKFTSSKTPELADGRIDE